MGTGRPEGSIPGRPSRTHTEEGRLPVTVAAPVREETHAPTPRAVGRYRDALRRDFSRGSSLGKVVAEVEGLRPSRHAEPQSLEYLRPHLVAGPTNSRSQVNRDVARRRTHSLPENVEAALQYSRGGTPPAGVEQSHRPPPRINQEYGHAIRGRHRQGYVLVGRGMPVTGLHEMESRPGGPVEANGTPVDLASMHDRG